MSDEPQASITTDLPWSLVPEWVLDADISDRAIRLYAILGRYADNDGACFPSRRTLADRMSCSVDSIDRASRELVDAGALSVKHRKDAQGDPTSNLYILHRVAATLRPPSRTGEEGGSRTGAAQNETHLEVSLSLEPLSLTANELRIPRAREKPAMKVDRKPVTFDEGWLAEMILDDWNTLTDQSLSSDEWRRKIILRIREHPELRIQEHTRIIKAALQDPWWSGHPSPAVIYGNGAVFEQAITLAQQGPAPPKATNGAMRYGRGVTPAQAIEAGRKWE